ncbi:MAG: replication factor C large subunit [Archaeoglobaceae archaeon]|nr:replication factor C large subunit [Archaeoglobaceae archaeon]MCX8152383.1 replication factor C large subunit [Archaeoglobaceae archaeon]MDW8013723.1 replication factor C large subunit [Archaeoglobaceae archaeon]
MLWVEKYRPKTLKDVVTKKEILEKALLWANKWKSGERQKPLLLAGPPGVGKTSLALALANTMGWEVVELNASDQRSFEVVQKIVGTGVLNETISDEGEFFSSSKGRLKLIVLDEVDNIDKKADFGGEAALIRIIKQNPRQPIILIANDPYILSLELRNLTEIVTFSRIASSGIVKVLEKICLQEGIKTNKKVLEKIAENAGGDLRAAINDLQAIAEGKKEITEDDLVVGKRVQETDVFKVMQKIFKTSYSGVYNEAMLLDESPEDLLHWISENVALEYSGKSLFNAHLSLSRADIFLGRVKRRQYYRLLRYATFLMTVGVQQAKFEVKKEFTKYQRPKVWQMLFQSKESREKLDRILSKISKYSHISKSKAKFEIYPYLKILLNSLDLEKAATVAVFYDLSEEDLNFIVGEEKASKIISKVKELGLHRIDETFLSAYEKRKEPKIERKEKVEKRSEVDRDKRKKTKDLTLDGFFRDK